VANCPSRTCHGSERRRCIDPAAVDEIIETYERRIGPRKGEVPESAEIRVWDSDYRHWLAALERSWPPND
jgi:hypothetical protein